MKLLKGFMAVALITTALTGSSFAVYTAGDQDNTSVADLKEVGYTSPKKLALTRAGVEAVYTPGSELDPARGPADPVKHAKAFFKGILDGTIARFDGADAGVKRGAFLTALDAAIAKAGTPALEVDVTAAGFNPSAAPVADKITAGVDALFALVAPTPVNPRIKLLSDAKAVGVKAPAGATSLDDLEAELASGDAGRIAAANAKIDALRYGKAGDRDLATKLARRVAKHDAATGVYKDLGLTGDAAKIKAFHDILEADRRTRTGGTAGDAAFANQVKALFDNQIIEGDSSTPEAMLTTLTNLAVQLSAVQGQLARMSAAGESARVVTSGEHARVIPGSHDMGGEQFKGGFNF